MIILITGASGFVGCNLAKYLHGKYTLWALSNSKPDWNMYTVHYTWEDWYKIPFEGIDVIIHLAGKAHDVKGKSDAQSYFDINTGLTQKIFDRFLASSIKQFIYFSSVKAAADITHDTILTENVMPQPKGAYGESKRKAEEYILNKDITDKHVHILRPCMIHGEGNKGNLNLLFSLINKGVPYPLGAFDNKRSFVSINNLCYIIESMISNTCKSGVYNIADDQSLSTNELIQIIGKATAKDVKIWRIPRTVIRYVAKSGDLLRLPLNTFRLNKLTESYEVSNTKIKKALDIHCLPLSATDGLEQTIKSFKSN